MICAGFQGILVPEDNKQNPGWVSFKQWVSLKQISKTCCLQFSIFMLEENRYFNDLMKIILTNNLMWWLKKMMKILRTLLNLGLVIIFMLIRMLKLVSAIFHCFQKTNVFLHYFERSTLKRNLTYSCFFFPLFHKHSLLGYYALPAPLNFLFRKNNYV